MTERDALVALANALDEHDSLVLGAVLEHYMETAHEQCYAGRSLCSQLLDALHHEDERPAEQVATEDHDLHA